MRLKSVHNTLKSFVLRQGRTAAKTVELRPERPCVATGARIYAIGDVHGCLRLFHRLLAAVFEDNLARPAAEVSIILLGDLIDRGKESALMLAFIAKAARVEGLTILKGNHEAALADAWRGDLDALTLWLRHGGDATLRGFGVPDDDIDLEGGLEMLTIVRRAVPRHLIDTIDALPLSATSGDFYFVHGGVRPGVPLDQQDGNDLLWIRTDFTESSAWHGKVVVHGHTINEDGVVILPNRIGVDTGAYRTGRLSAVAFEAGEQWPIEVTEPISS